MDGRYARRENGVKKKVNYAGVRKEAVMAESVPENSEEATGVQGGETVWVSVCLGGQFAKLKLQKSGRRTKLRLAWEIIISTLI